MAGGQGDERGWRLSLGRVSGIPILLEPAWFLVAVALTFLVAPVAESRLPGLGSGAYVVGLLFAVLLYGSVFVHEMAHALAAQRLGMRVARIRITLLGGVSEIADDRPSPGRDAIVAVVGPLASLVIAGLAWWVGGSLGDGLVAFLVFEMAVANLLVGGFNLVPSLPLDGGHLLKDGVWAVSGRESAGYAVAGRMGYLLAVVLLLLPWLMARPGTPSAFSVVWSVLLAWFVVGGARSAVRYAQASRRFDALRAGGMLRPAVAVGPRTSVQAALSAAGGSSVVVTDEDGRPAMVVDPAAVALVPPHRLADLPVSAVARTLPTGAVLPADLSGAALLRRLDAAPTLAYPVVDAAGHVSGVVLARDVQAALRG